MKTFLVFIFLGRLLFFFFFLVSYNYNNEFFTSCLFFFFFVKVGTAHRPSLCCDFFVSSFKSKTKTLILWNIFCSLLLVFTPYFKMVLYLYNMYGPFGNPSGDQKTWNEKQFVILTSDKEQKTHNKIFFLASKCTFWHRSF